MKEKLNINEIFKKLVFSFVCVFAFGVMNVSAVTVIVETEQQLKDAVDGGKVIEGNEVTDTDTTLVKLGSSIILTENLDIRAITDLTLDLSGYTIDGEVNSKSVHIYYGDNGYETFASGSLVIKDSSSGKTGTIKSYDSISINSDNYNGDINKHFALTIEGGKFYILSNSVVFALSDSSYYMKNTEFDFQINDGYFEVTGTYAMLLRTDKTTVNNVTLNVNYDRLTFKGLQSRLIYFDKSLTVGDVVSADSNIKLKYSTSNIEGELTDRTLSATTYNAFESVIGDYDTIEITKKDGFDVSNVNLNETYGYDVVIPKGIEIKNRGTSPLQIKSVSVSGIDGEKFEIIGPSTAPTLAAGATDNTSYTIKPKLGLNVGDYIAIITVTDMENKTYTATVTLTVEKKSAEGVVIDMLSFMYGDTPNKVYVESGDLQTGQYVIEYSIKGAEDWTMTAPTKAGLYTVRLSTTDDNFVEQTWSVDYEIQKNDIEIQIIANSNEWIYDGNNHSNSSYVVKYDGVICTDGILPTGDKVIAVVSGSVKDVKDTRIGNNVVTSFTITDSDGVDSKDSYLTKITTAGTLTIKPIATPVSIKAASDSKPYDGSALTKNTYTITSGGILSSDTLIVTIEGSQTYVGESANKVKDVKVMRDGEDITSNYTFSTHTDGILKVTAVDQPLSIADQYVTINGMLSTSELEDALIGAEGNVSFEVKSGAIGEYNKDTIGGFLAGSSIGTVIMTVKAEAYDANGDRIYEYNETEKDFNIYVVAKETVVISGITDNQEFTYDGTIKEPAGTISVNEDKVPVSELKVSYAGTGSTVYSSTTAPTNVGTYSVTYKVPNSNANYMGSVTLNFTIKKANPSYLVPTDLTGLKGQTLSNITLPSGFTWNDASESLVVGMHTYKATYTPSDTANYNVMNNIDITVITKNVFNVTTSVVGGNGTISVSYSNVEDGATKEITFTPNTGFMIDKVLVNGVETSVANNKLTLVVNEDKDVKVSYKKIPFTITVIDTEGAIITPNGVVLVNYGDSKEFTITVDIGYRLIKVLVDGVNKIEDMTYDGLTLNNITANMKIEVVVEKIVYEVIEGANQKYTITESSEAKFRIDADYSMLTDGGYVYVDDMFVDSENYTSEEGSTIIILKRSFVDTLSVGQHTLKVVFADAGEAITNFTVEKVASEIENPSTGDNISLYVTVCILSVIGLIGASVFVIRRKQEN